MHDNSFRHKDFFSFILFSNFCKYIGSFFTLHQLPTDKVSLINEYISNNNKIQGFHFFSSSSGTDFPDSLSLSLSLSLSSVPIIYCFRQVFQATACVCTGLMYICSCWSANTSTSICSDTKKIVTNKFVLASLEMTCKSWSSNLDGSRDGR